MPGWKGSRRRQTLPADWEERRRRILRRDRYRCQHVRDDTGEKCGARANQVDHVERGAGDHDGNLQALCEWHHNQKSGREGGRASQAKRREQTRRQQPLHPGLIAGPGRPMVTDQNDPSPF